MRCVAVIQTDQLAHDTVILWDADGRLIAFAYLDGQVKMTRPLAAATLEEGITETQTGFQIQGGQITRIADWANLSATSSPSTAPARWGFSR